MDAHKLNERATQALDHVIGAELCSQGVYAIVLLAHVGPERGVSIGVASNANQKLTAFCAAYLADQLGGRLETPNAAEIADKLQELVVLGAEQMAKWPDLTRVAVMKLLSDPFMKRLAELIELSTDRQMRRSTEATDPNAGATFLQEGGDPELEGFPEPKTVDAPAPGRAPWTPPVDKPLDVVPDCGDAACPMNGTPHVDCDLSPEENARLIAAVDRSKAAGKDGGQ